MKKFLLVPILALILVFSLNSPVAAKSPSGPPYNWQAHPPIHVKPNTTTSPTGLLPTQVRQAYGFDQLSADGSGQTIAIIDAYDAPTIESDLQTFTSKFNLQTMSFNTTSSPWFQKVYAQGSQPRTNSGWALEASLDVEWAHAIAPQANILLVEAASSRFSDLLAAVDVAVNSGADVVSMSWGGSEFSSESSYDFHFKKSGVVFTASSGDSGAGVSYPAASPYVLGVGGTTLNLDSSGNVTSETAWSESGGGISSYEAEPGYQSSYPMPSSGGKRGIPDVSYDANPNTGFPVYDSTSYQGQSGWWQVGGTSAGAPQWAALVALADQLSGSPLSGNYLNSSAFYNAATANYAANYRDITSGSNGYSAGTGYDFVTGLGSPKANSLVTYLAGGTVSKNSSDTTTSLSSNSITLGQSIICTATVTGSSSVAPTGTVQFQVSTDGNTFSNLGTTVNLNTSGTDTDTSTATYTYAPQTAGTYYLRAVYGGDSNYNTSTSPNETLTVTNVSTVGASLSPSTQSSTVNPGETATYSYTLKNTGSSSATFSLSSTSQIGWNVSVSSASISLDAGQSTTVQLSVTADPNATAGTTDTETLTASGPATASATATTTIAASTATSSSFQPVEWSTFGGKNGTNNLRITLTLLDNTSTPVNGATISVNLYLNNNLYDLASGTTGTNGSVTFTDTHAPPGPYSLIVESVVSTPAWDHNQPSNNTFTK